MEKRSVVEKNNNGARLLPSSDRFFSFLPFPNSPLPPASASTLPSWARWTGWRRPGGWRSLPLLLKTRKKKTLEEEQQRAVVAAAVAAAEEEQQGEKMSSRAAEAEEQVLEPVPLLELLQEPVLPCDPEETRGALPLRWTPEQGRKREQEQAEVAAPMPPMHAAADDARHRCSRSGSLQILLRLPGRAGLGSLRTPRGPP